MVAGPSIDLSGCPASSWSAATPTGGLTEAIGATLPGASWQGCATPANLMAAAPKSAWGWVRALLHSVYGQPDRSTPVPWGPGPAKRQAPAGGGPSRRHPRLHPGFTVPQGDLAADLV